MKTITLVFLSASLALAQPKLWIAPGHYTTPAVIERCPAAVTVTGERAQADYWLDISGSVTGLIPRAVGAATLYRQNGDAVTIFRARTVKGLVGQVCGYFEALPKK